jgi:hypothetical protein
MHECNNKNEENRWSFNGCDETAQSSTCGNGCLGICDILYDICDPWLSYTSYLIF